MRRLYRLILKQENESFLLQYLILQLKNLNFQLHELDLTFIRPALSTEEVWQKIKDVVHL